MKIIKKIGIFALVAMLLISILSLNVFAADAASYDTTGEEAVSTAVKDDDSKLDMSLKPESFSERLEYAIQGTATGLLMVFSVLVLLTVILYVSKYIFYDIPNNREKTAAEEKALEKAAEEATKSVHAQIPQPINDPEPETVANTCQDDGELAAVITAAIAAMIESGDYKNEFVGGFRVVSFKRSTQSAWNRK